MKIRCCLFLPLRLIFTVVPGIVLMPDDGFSQPQHLIPVDTLKRLSMEELVNLDVNTVSSNMELNVRLTWMPLKKLEISATGQNLLYNHHAEYIISKPNPSAEIERSMYIKAAFRL